MPELHGKEYYEIPHSNQQDFQSRNIYLQLNLPSRPTIKIKLQINRGDNNEKALTKIASHQIEQRKGISCNCTSNAATMKTQQPSL
jgi:hypothetical protein